MADNIKIINFLQDFGCARQDQLQILFNDSNNNFKNILNSRVVSKKKDIFVHNTRTISDEMLVALDILCKYRKRLLHYFPSQFPVYVSFITTDQQKYNIIVAETDNVKGIVKLVNSYPDGLPPADKLILVFPNENELENIHCIIPFIYATYPDLKIINK